MNTADALDAVARLDDGHDQPGDQELADGYDWYCRLQWDRIQSHLDNLAYEEWLGTQCRVCGPDGAWGDPCGYCWANADLHTEVAA